MKNQPFEPEQSAAPFAGEFGESSADDGSMEPSTIFISDDWDVIGEDYLDDYDDLGDLDFPSLDDDY